MPRGQWVLYTTMGGAPYKGLETLVEAVALLCKAGHDVVLRVGGDLDGSELGLATRRLARRLGVAARCVELGPLGAQEVVSEVLGCNLYVSPSHADNSPNSLCEAQVLGAPCIAASVGGIPSLIEHDVTGYLFTDGDYAGLAATVERAMHDAVATAGVAAAGAHAARARHDREQVVAQTVAVYQSVARAAEARQGQAKP
jgi:glycosyltransferase involved in cell wall biosynthesis